MLGTFAKTVNIPERCPEYSIMIPYHPYGTWLNTTEALRIFTVNGNRTLTGAFTASTKWAYAGDSPATVKYSWSFAPNG